MSALLVFVSFPDAETARRIATTVVTERLAACFHLLPAGESIYRWQGKVETAGEVAAIGKTTEVAWPALESRLRELHPYEVPEILAVPVGHGLPAYLRWLEAETVTP